MNPRRDRTGPTPVSRILGDALRECGLGERLEERAPLDHWPQIVGEEIARHSRAVDIIDGVLFVDADHGAWKQELTLLVPQIIEKFNAAFGAGTVTEVRWGSRPVHGRKRGYGK